MKGIVLAGGTGSRLFPITLGTSKQLLPIYDKPMIYYSLSVLMLAGIREILIISTLNDIANYKRLFRHIQTVGISLSFKVQEKPNGIAEAFVLGEEFIGNDDVCLILGDNFFYGQGFSPLLKKIKQELDGATLLTYPVIDPQRFGIIDINTKGEIISIEEKPKEPKTNQAVTGLYFYSNSVIQIAKQLKPSARDELEITDVNKVYLNRKSLKYEKLGRGFTWLDTGTPDALLEASMFVQTIQTRQGLFIGCLEEIALKEGWLDKVGLQKDAYYHCKNSYVEYVNRILEEHGN